ncbi:MAG TPA: dihydrolipoamide acetyltransferase family protein [Phycisphaerae bacterium]|nr:dihydrolipoamide acetyltransferase family protein [Phycisphaerae bacterium]
MAKEFKLPDLGEGIHEAAIVNVNVAEGDTVKEDQMVMEVETDKAAVELPVPFAGKITKLNVKKGDTVKVGSVLLTVDGGDGEARGEENNAPASHRPAARRDEEETEEGQAEDTEETAEEPEEESERPPSREVPEPRRAAAGDEGPASRESGPIPAAPAIRRQAREMGIDLREVHGTGPGGRIVREDLERFQLAGPTGQGRRPTPKTAPPAEKPAAAKPVAEKPSAPSRAPAAPAAAPAPAEAMPDFSFWGPVRREAIPQIRKAIARAMVRSVTTIPHVTHADEVDITDLESFRREQSEIFADKGAKLTLTAFVVKAVAGALRQFPQFNASFDDAQAEIIFKDYVNIGIAVDSPKGLVVPVLRDADRKGLLTISKELKEIGDKARDFKLDIAEMRGGTFTVTNVGAMGGTMATPIINWPEVAILGMGKLDLKPVVRDGQIVARKILPLFLSFDHRVIDGADGARFIRAIMGYLENPLNLLLVS